MSEYLTHTTLSTCFERLVLKSINNIHSYLCKNGQPPLKLRSRKNWYYSNSPKFDKSLIKHKQLPRCSIKKEATTKRRSVKTVFFFASWYWQFHRIRSFRWRAQGFRTVAFRYRSIIILKNRYIHLYIFSSFKMLQVGSAL